MKHMDSHPAHSEPATSGSPAVQSATFVHDGDYWTIGYGATTFPLRDILGLTYIHHLLQQPGEQFHALDLLTGSAAGEALPAAARFHLRLAGDPICFLPDRSRLVLPNVTIAKVKWPGCDRSYQRRIKWWI